MGLGKRCTLKSQREYRCECVLLYIFVWHYHISAFIMCTFQFSTTHQTFRHIQPKLEHVCSAYKPLFYLTKLKLTSCKDKIKYMACTFCVCVCAVSLLIPLFSAVILVSPISNAAFSTKIFSLHLLLRNVVCDVCASAIAMQTSFCSSSQLALLYLIL